MKLDGLKVKSKVENIRMPLEIHGNRFNAYSMDIAQIKEFLEMS